MMAVVHWMHGKILSLSKQSLENAHVYYTQLVLTKQPTKIIASFRKYKTN